MRVLLFHLEDGPVLVWLRGDRRSPALGRKAAHQCGGSSGYYELTGARLRVLRAAMGVKEFFMLGARQPAPQRWEDDAALSPGKWPCGC